ncbi:hypothetical protein ACRAWD_15720 [Caulobacter segnis]
MLKAAIGANPTSAPAVEHPGDGALQRRRQRRLAGVLRRGPAPRASNSPRPTTTAPSPSWTWATSRARSRIARRPCATLARPRTWR